MKRIISLFLVAVVLVFSFAVPSFASGIDLESNDSWIDVMDFSDLGQKYTKNGYNYVNVSLPLNKVYYGIEFVVYDATKINNVYFDHPSQGMMLFKKVDIGSGYYRYYINLMWTGDSLPLVFDVTNRNSEWFQFLSFKVHYSSVDYFTSTGTAFGYLPDDSSFEISTSGNQAVFFGFDDFLNTRFDFEVFCNDWKKFDYLDFSLEISGGSINSISASLDGLTLPFTHTIVQSSSGENTWFLQIRLDLRGINRTSTSMPHITIAGHASTVDLSDISYIAINHCTGILLLNDIDPFFIYFRDLGIKIQAGFSSVVSKIETWGQNIVDAITGDSSAADQFKDQIDESNKELDDMTAVMNSFTTPDINSINVNVDSFVTPSDISSLTAPMSMLFESNIVVTCIMIAIILGTVMFVLYGKR